MAESANRSLEALVREVDTFNRERKYPRDRWGFGTWSRCFSNFCDYNFSSGTKQEFASGCSVTKMKYFFKGISSHKGFWRISRWVNRTRGLLHCWSSSLQVLNLPFKHINNIKCSWEGRRVGFLGPLVRVLGVVPRRRRGWQGPAGDFADHFASFYTIFFRRFASESAIPQVPPGEAGPAGTTGTWKTCKVIVKMSIISAKTQLQKTKMIRKRYDTTVTFKKNTETINVFKGKCESVERSHSDPHSRKCQTFSFAT